MGNADPNTSLPAGTTPPAPRKPSRRSRVTNGAALPATGDGNSMWGRRFADLLASHVSDLGGPDAGLSEAQISLVRRCATIEVELEAMEAKLSNGQDVDLDVYGRLLGHLRRALESLGIQRVAKVITQPLGTWEPSNAQPPPAADAAPVKDWHCTGVPATCNRWSCPCAGPSTTAAKGE